jgi:hypothetical protein
MISTVKPVLNGSIIKRKYLYIYHSIPWWKWKPAFRRKMFWALEIPFKTGFIAFSLIFGDKNFTIHRLSSLRLTKPPYFIFLFWHDAWKPEYQSRSKCSLLRNDSVRVNSSCGNEHVRDNRRAGIFWRVLTVVNNTRIIGFFDLSIVPYSRSYKTQYFTWGQKQILVSSTPDNGQSPKTTVILNKRLPFIYNGKVNTPL